MCDYPYTDKTADKPFTEKTTDAPLGRIRLLKDDDGDGIFDRSTIFAENLSWPTGLALWRGGVYVLATPDLWYLKDTDGDGVADVRRKVLTGFRKFNVQAVVNNLKWGLDHRLYGAGGSNGGTLSNPALPNEKPQTFGAQDFSFDPRHEEFDFMAGGARFGQTFDDWGNRFLCNIRNPIQHAILPSKQLARNPFAAVRTAINDVAVAGDTIPVYRTSPPEPWRVLNSQRLAADRATFSPRSETVAAGYFTSACGVTVYRGSAYPRSYYGDVFLGEVSGNLIHRQKLTQAGVTFIASRVEENVEFLTSTDNWFRPVNFVNAPDGTLHVLDMYRETIEHPWSIPDDIKAALDLESGRDRGRIYRLEPPEFRRGRVPRLSKATTAELVDELSNPDSWWRETAHRLLFERGSASKQAASDATAGLRELLHLKRFIVPASSQTGPELSDLKAIAQIHALWSLDGLGTLSNDDLIFALSVAHARVREHAVRLAESRLQESEMLRSSLLQLAGDTAPRVSLEIAFALGAVRHEEAIDGLARIALQHGNDEWIRTSIVSASGDRGAMLVLRLLTADTLSETAQSARLSVARDLAAMIGNRNQQTELAELLVAVMPLTSRAEQQRRVAIEVLLGINDSQRKKSGKNVFALLPDKDASAAVELRRLVAQAEQTATDETASLPDRVQAIQLLTCSDFAVIKGTLAKLLEPKRPPQLQSNVVRTLAAFRQTEVPELLVAQYRYLTPPVQAEIVDVLYSRPEWLDALLSALESKAILPSDLPLPRRNLLTRHKTEAIKQRALAIFGTESNASRKEVLATYQAALSLKADKERGQAVFKKSCATCHRFGEDGKDVGPNLNSIRHRAPAEILMHVLDPNREVAPNFMEYIVELDDGRIARGVVSAETPTSLTLTRPDGMRETILRQHISMLSNTRLSFMPEGLEKTVSQQEMTDLLGYLLAR